MFGLIIMALQVIYRIQQNKSQFEICKSCQNILKQDFENLFHSFFRIGT